MEFISIQTLCALVMMLAMVRFVLNNLAERDAALARLVHPLKSRAPRGGSPVWQRRGVTREILSGERR